MDTCIYLSSAFFRAFSLERCQTVLCLISNLKHILQISTIYDRVLNVSKPALRVKGLSPKGVGSQKNLLLGGLPGPQL